MHQGDDACRADRGGVAEFDLAAPLAEFESGDAQRREPQLQGSHLEQLRERRRQVSEAVDHLGAQFVEFALGGGGADALVHDQPQVDVGQVVLGDQRAAVQVDLPADRCEGPRHVRRIACLNRLDGAVEHLHVEAESH